MVLSFWNANNNPAPNTPCTLRLPLRYSPPSIMLMPLRRFTASSMSLFSDMGSVTSALSSSTYRLSCRDLTINPILARKPNSSVSIYLPCIDTSGISPRLFQSSVLINGSPPRYSMSLSVFPLKALPTYLNSGITLMPTAQSPCCGRMLSVEVSTSLLVTTTRSFAIDAKGIIAEAININVFFISKSC